MPKLGTYESWFDGEVIVPGALSLRSGKFENVDLWRRQARARVWERLAAPDKARSYRRSRTLVHGASAGS